MKPKKIKLELVSHKFDDGQATLILQIKEVNYPDGWSGRDFNFRARNGFTVSSAAQPELKDTTIYIWGRDTSRNLIPLTKSFRTYGALREYVGILQYALKEWADEFEAFRTGMDVETVPVDIEVGTIFEISA